MQESRPYNSTYPEGGISCSKDSLVVNQTLVFQIKLCVPHLRDLCLVESAHADSEIRPKAKPENVMRHSE